MKNSIASNAFSKSPEGFFGIDVSKERLEIAQANSPVIQTLANEESAIAEWVTLLRGQVVHRIVVEATGGYEAKVVLQLAAAKFPVVVVNPRQVRDYARGLGILAKTDHLDATVLARFAAEVRPEIRPIPAEDERRLAELQTRRQQLLQMHTAERNRQEHSHDPQVRESLSAVLQVLEEQIGRLDQELSAMVQANAAWHAKETILRTEKGVGPIVSRTLIADLPELGRLNRRQIASLVGLAPFNRDSGKWRGQRRVFGGRGSVRAALYMAAVTAIQWNPKIRPYYQRLIERGKCFKVAITACMRKLLTILNAIARDHQLWKIAPTTPISP